MVMIEREIYGGNLSSTFYAKKSKLPLDQTSGSWELFNIYLKRIRLLNMIIPAWKWFGFKETPITYVVLHLPTCSFTRTSIFVIISTIVVG